MGQSARFLELRRRLDPTIVPVFTFPHLATLIEDEFYNPSDFESKLEKELIPLRGVVPPLTRCTIILRPKCHRENLEVKAPFRPVVPVANRCQDVYHLCSKTHHAGAEVTQTFRFFHQTRSVERVI